MFKVIENAAGLISVLFFFIAAGSDNWTASLCAAGVAVLFAVIEHTGNSKETDYTL